LVEHPRVSKGRSVVTPTGTVSTRSAWAKMRGAVALSAQKADDLAMLIDCRVQLRLLSGDLDVGLIDEPPVTGSVPARPGRNAELRGERLHPPVHADVIHLDAALGQQHVAGVTGPRARSPQGEPEACVDRGRTTCSHQTSLHSSAIDQRNSAGRLHPADITTLAQVIPMMDPDIAVGSGSGSGPTG